MKSLIVSILILASMQSSFAQIDKIYLDAPLISSSFRNPYYLGIEMKKGEKEGRYQTFALSYYKHQYNLSLFREDSSSQYYQTQLTRDRVILPDSGKTFEYSDRFNTVDGLELMYGHRYYGKLKNLEVVGSWFAQAGAQIGSYKQQNGIIKPYYHPQSSYYYLTYKQTSETRETFVKMNGSVGIETGVVFSMGEHLKLMPKFRTAIHLNDLAGFYLDPNQERYVVDISTSFAVTLAYKINRKEESLTRIF